MHNNVYNPTYIINRVPGYSKNLDFFLFLYDFDVFLFFHIENIINLMLESPPTILHKVVRFIYLKLKISIIEFERSMSFVPSGFKL